MASKRKTDDYQAAADSSDRHVTISTFSGQGILNSGEGGFHVGRDLNIVPDHSGENNRCLADLCITDPRDDKRRIEHTKGGILQDSYSWILDNADFQRWRIDPQYRLLWIKGDPGKGKTMLLCGIIDELKKSSAGTNFISFFFCQATDFRINNATAVLRGLIYLLLVQQPSLISHLRRKYDHAGKKLFEDANVDLCKTILAIISIVYRPITLEELISLIESLETIYKDIEELEEIIKLCGSFLTLRDKVVYFRHQSAKDFLFNKASHQILPFGIEKEHYIIFSRSIQVMSRALQRNIYKLRHPGILINEVIQPETDPLAPARYSCVYWVDHLLESIESAELGNDLRDEGVVENFLKQIYLYWLEALSLLKNVPKGVLSITNLENLLQEKVETHQLFNLVRDMRRFLLHTQWAIENSPLQVYASALVFSPAYSMTRLLFQREEAKWLISPDMQDDWSPCLQTLEGHGGPVKSVAFSPDSSRLASGSRDSIVKIWDTAAGQCLQTLGGHGVPVTSVAFSPESSQLASGSWDGIVKIWDPATGQCLRTFKIHRALEDISFDSTGAYLNTDLGVFEIDPLSASNMAQKQQNTIGQLRRHGYGISSDRAWIMGNAKNLLWLPSEYRPICSAIAASTVALGCASGRVLFFGFCNDSHPWRKP